MLTMKNLLMFLWEKYGITEEMINSLKKAGYRFFFDMDNTACLWCKKGEDMVTLERVYEEGFFLNLPPIDNIQEAVEALVLLGFEVSIISACVDSVYCEKEKREWVKKYLPWIKEENIIFCKMGQDKSQFIKGDIKTAVLVDDYKKNLEDFQKAGGKVIKKSHSGKARPIPFIVNHLDIFGVMRVWADSLAA